MSRKGLGSDTLLFKVTTERFFSLRICTGELSRDIGAHSSNDTIVAVICVTCVRLSEEIVQYSTQILSTNIWVDDCLYSAVTGVNGAVEKFMGDLRKRMPRTALDYVTLSSQRCVLIC